MDKTRSRAVASRGKKGKSKGGHCSKSNPPPSERNPIKVKSKVKKNKKKTEETKEEEEKKEETFSFEPVSRGANGQTACNVLKSDDSWDGPTFIGADGKRRAMAFGLIWDSDDDEW